MLKSRYDHVKTVYSIQILIAIVAIFYLFKALNRGFEITDESYYILLASHPDAVTAYNSAQHWITGGIWKLTGTISSFRFSGFVILLLSATVLSTGTLSLISKNFTGFSNNILTKGAFIASSCLSALMYGTTINFSPCYNLLATSGAYAVLGIAFYAFSNPMNYRFKLISYTICGIALSIEIISKASSGIATFVLIMILIWAFERDLKSRIFSFISLVITVTVSLYLIMLINTNLKDFQDSFRLGMIMFNQVQSESIVSRMFRYYDDIYYGVIGIAKTFYLPILLSILSRRYQNLAFGYISIFSLLLIFLLENYFYGGVGQFDKNVSAVLLLISLAAIASIKGKIFKSKISLILISLFLLPYSVAAGSGNSLYTQVIISMAPWGVLISALCIFELNNEARSRYAWYLWVIISLAFLSQIISCLHMNPYQLNAPTSKQEIETSISNYGKINVDQGTADFIQALNDAAIKCHIGPNLPFLGLYNNPGLALVLSGVPLVSPWLSNVEQANTAIETVDSNILSKAVIGLHINNQGEHDQLPKKLINFPTEYNYCGSASYPWQNKRYQIWMPKR